MGNNEFPHRAAANPAWSGRQPLSILFVDPDSEQAQRLAQPLLGRYALAVVPSARAAMTAINVKVPTLIVMELDLPDVNGLEFISMIHTSPALHNVLLLVITSRKFVQDKISAFQAGADDYLVKPVDQQQFLLHLQLLTRFRKVIGS